MPVPSNRNSVGQGSVIFYVLGALCAIAGIYISTITRVNLLTDQTSWPFLGIGIPLALGGILVVALAQRTAKRNLTK